MNPSNKRLIGIGTVAVDDLLYVRSFPGPNRKTPVLRQARRFGGLIGTALAAASRLGVSSAYAGVLGRDELSAALRKALEAVGVDCGPALIREGIQSAHSIIIMAEAGHTRNIFYRPQKEGPQAEELSGELLGRAEVILADQLALPAFRLAHGLGVPVVADMEWVNWPGTSEMLSLTQHLIVPLEFARAYTGVQEAEQTVSLLHESPARACTAVTCGIEGCYYLAGASSVRVEHQPSFPVAVKETNGCGDVFHGAYAAALVSGCSVPAGLRYAAAAAALYAARPNGWEHLPTESEIEAFLQRNG